MPAGVGVGIGVGCVDSRNSVGGVGGGGVTACCVVGGWGDGCGDPLVKAPHSRSGQASM